MTNQEKDLGTMIRAANAALTPGVLVCISLFAFAFLVLAKLETEGLQRFTAGWFWPIGPIAALAGTGVAFVVACRHRQVGKFLLLAFFAAFLPGFVQFLMTGSQDTPENWKIVLSVWLMLAPWAAAIGIHFEFKKRTAS